MALLPGKSRGVSNSIGGILRRRRIEEGLSQSVVAKRAGIHAAMLSRIERDERSDPYFTTVARVARVLSLSLDEIASSRAGGEKVARSPRSQHGGLVAAHAEVQRIRKQMERLAKRVGGLERRLDSISK